MEGTQHWGMNHFAGFCPGGVTPTERNLSHGMEGTKMTKFHF